MGKQYLNGVLYGSPTVVADEVVDYNTSLYNGSTSSWATTISYTATSKCIAYLRYTGNNGTNMYPILNGGNALVNLGILKTNGYYTCSIILQPGDTLASRYQADEDRYGTPYFHMKIYTIKANKSENYSTTERIIGTWIDGKPLYEKTINTGALPNNATNNVNHGISNLKRVIGVSGYAYRSSGDIVNIPLPYVGNNSNLNTVVYVGLSHIGIVTFSDRSAFTESYVTLRYTKTTD